MAEQIRMLAEDGQPTRYEDLGRQWLAAPNSEPIVVVHSPDGWAIWDGNHRTGIAHTAGLLTVPAFVGEYQETL